MTEAPFRFRTGLAPGDPADIRHLVAATRFFHDEEVAIAGELADDFLARGNASDYRFLLADTKEGLAGYACYGRIPGTASSWDLYWIAVQPEYGGRGLGRTLMAQAENAILGEGGTRVYVDTSARAQYEPTRRFYERCGYAIAAELPEFYGPGDGKVIFVKALAPG